MRALIGSGIAAALVGVLLVGSTPARAGGERKLTNHQACRRMTKQIAHFEDRVLPMADGRANSAWAEATLDHIDHLKNRRADMCPEYGAERSFLAKRADELQRANKMLKRAAKIAGQVLTGGALP